MPPVVRSDGKYTVEAAIARAKAVALEAEEFIKREAGRLKIEAELAASSVEQAIDKL